MKKYILVDYNGRLEIDVNKNYQKWYKNYTDGVNKPILASNSWELLNEVKGNLENGYN